MGWNKENRPPADFFPNTDENTTPGGVIDTGKLTCVDLCVAGGNDEITLGAGDTRPFPRRLWYDASSQVSIRLVANEITATGAGRIAVVFRTAVAGSDTDSGDGGIEVAIPFTATGPAKTGWFTINAAAQADVLFEVVGRDADGTEKVRGVHIQFLNGAVDPCAGEGCPIPVGIYNGEDFSTWTDEADFLSFVEAESDNRYWVWYGDDGSVEGVSFDPDLSFCGNPVVVGRWVGTGADSTIWDITGFGMWTRFSNPIGDDGSGSFPPRVGFAYVWATIRLKIEDGWNADDGFGFTLSDLMHGGNGINGDARVVLRDGRVIFGCQADSSVPYTEYDLGPASLLVGTADFMDLTIHGTISDLGGGLWQIQDEVFINVSCDVATPGDVGSESATPLATYTATVVPTPIGGVVANLKFYDWDKFNYTSDHAQWPEKKIWVAQWFYSGSLT